MTEVGSTYRVQLHPGFTLDDAGAEVDYLASLGISHLYCSPYLRAAPGSTHGYDVVDHTQVSPDLGGEEAHGRLAGALARAGLGQVLDIVPNHMAIALPDNRWFWDVLEHGRASRYSGHFDVDWEPPEPYLRDRVLMPILSDHYGRVLEAGRVRLERHRGRFTIRYHDHLFPLAPESLAGPIGRAAGTCSSNELASIGRDLGGLPQGPGEDRYLRTAEVLGRLDRLLGERPEVDAALDDEVARINADPDALDALLEDQHYRLAYWRAGRQDLGYRRFFDVDTLIGLRTEDPRVFDDVHSRVVTWVGEGLLDGLRIDHPDGLSDPAGYLDRLRKATPRAWLVVEKILEPGERLPLSWPVDGTTGYDFLNDVGAVFVDPAGRIPLTEAYARLTGEDRTWAEVRHEAKRRVVSDLLAADLNRLTNIFVRVCEGRRRYRDFARHELGQALGETLAGFEVYRTYVGEDGQATPEDRERIEAAVAEARRGRPDLDGEVFDLLGAVLAGDLGGGAETELRMRFQQLSGPVMAKGVEDTAFYRYHRLAALCEVGGDPDRFGYQDLEEFHRRCEDAHEGWPRSMLALSTHDTKRSEDVRARLYLLSEVPGRWEEAVGEWMDHNRRHRPRPDRPDTNAEYLLYQTLVGAHPIGVERVRRYMEKATKEAKVHTSWIDPDPDYDQAMARFVEAVMGDAAFGASLERFARPLVRPGRVTSLAQKLIQLTAPGVPDTYQGNELWDLSLVDPDNRRPVDFGLRRRLLDALGGMSPGEILDRAHEGLPKLWVTHRALRLRCERPGPFGPGPAGAYRAAPAEGGAARHVVAFTRGQEVAVVAPRLVMGLAEAGGWGDTTVSLPEGRWVDQLTGEVSGPTVEVGRLLDRFPVALLARTAA